MTRWLPLLLVACGGDPATEGPSAADTAAVESSSARVASVVSSIAFVDAEGEVTEGFDLDGFVSDGDDAEGCGHADRVDASGVEGIDNAFADLVPVLRATEASALEDLLGQSIANGELLILVELSEVDVDPTLPVEDWDDACVDLTVWRGEGEPLLAADGSLLDRQTFQTADPVTIQCVPMVDGAVEAKGFSVVLPMQVLDVEMVLHLSDAAIRVAHQPDGSVVGLLGGGVPMSDFEVVLAERDIADLAELLRPVIENLLDLQVDGVCDAMSVSLAFEGLPAFVADGR